MANFCIPKKLSDQLKKAAQAGEIKIQDLYDMGSSAKRRELFEQYTNKEIAAEINAGFEKAMKADSAKALENWVEKTFNGKEKIQKQNILDRIKSLDESGLLSFADEKAYLQDLVAEKLGATISAEEVKTINQKVKDLEKLTTQKDANGNYTLEYWKTRTEIEGYIQSLTPSNNLAIITSTIGRGNLLFQTGSVVTNTAINTVTSGVVKVENFITEAIDSALQGKIPTIKGVNGKIVREYIKAEIKMQVYAKRGLSRMIDLSDGIKQLGEQFTHSQGEGAIRKIGRVYEDVVFNLSQGVPDSIFAASSFAHTADFLSTKEMQLQGFKGEALKKNAEIYLRDAMNVEPKTEIGTRIRAEAQEAAFTSTNTQNSIYAQVVLGIRNIIDKGTGNLKVGSLAVPFAKTPANAIGASLNRTGLSLLSGVKDFATKGVFKEAKTGNRIPLKSAIRKIIQSGLGITAAYLLAQYIDRNNFIGAYSPDAKIRQARGLMGGNSNMMKIGDKWVSTDYLGPLQAPFNAAMYLKQNDGDIVTAQKQTISEQLLKAPGVSAMRDFFDSLETANQQGTAELEKAFLSGAVDAVYARLVPAFIQQTAKATDQFERQPEKGDIVQGIMAKLPGLRESLPIKKSVLGELVVTQSSAAIFLSGSRITNAKENVIIKELNALDITNQRPLLPDLTKPTGRLADLKVQIGKEEFQKAQDFYYEHLKSLLEKTVTSPSYQKSTEDIKKARIQKAVDNITMKTLGKFDYKKPKKQHVEKP